MLSGAAVLLCAGFSTRFGSDKRKHRLFGQPIIRKTVDLYLSVFDRVVVVVRPTDDVVDLLPATCEIVEAEDAHMGMSRSLAAGIKAVSEEPWVVLGLGDMPFVSEATLTLLKTRIDQGDFGIVRPFYEGTPGNPVAFSCSHFDNLVQFKGDSGARDFLRSNRDLTSVLSVQDPGICRDIDTKADIAQPI